jgi:hypothetical protein
MSSRNCGAGSILAALLTPRLWPGSSRSRFASLARSSALSRCCLLGGPKPYALTLLVLPAVLLVMARPLPRALSPCARRAV